MTCNACNIYFGADADIRAHYAEPFHTTNLKRRVAEMAPLTPAAFARMAAEEEARVAARAAAVVAAAVVYICDACGKSFASSGQFDAHNASARHKERVKGLLAARRAAKKLAAASDVCGEGDAAAAEAVAAAAAAAAAAAEEEIVLDESVCVFCWAKNGDMGSNLVHMESAHSFFIPDVGCCTDPAGLLSALHERVSVDAACLWCDSEKEYSCGQSAQTHMADKGHCLLRYEAEHHFARWEAYYDYSDFKPTAPVEINQDGELVLPNGRTALTKDVARIYKQHSWAPPESEAVKSVLSALKDRYEESGRGGVAPRSAEAQQRAAAAAARNTGTRGNGTDAVAQRRAQKHYSKFSLQIGLQMNHIRREFFRVATTLTGRTG